MLGALADNSVGTKTRMARLAFDFRNSICERHKLSHIVAVAGTQHKEDSRGHLPVVQRLRTGWVRRPFLGGGRSGLINVHSSSLSIGLAIARPAWSDFILGLQKAICWVL